MAVDYEGNLWTWGNNGSGQLGDGTTNNRVVPQKIMNGTKFKKVYARCFSSLAIDINGNIWSWGNNGWAELGDGTTTDRLTPVQIN